MAIDVVCGSCWHKSSVRDDQAGTRVTCGGCGAMVTVPAPAPVPQAPTVPLTKVDQATQYQRAVLANLKQLNERLERIEKNSWLARKRLGSLELLAIVFLVAQVVSCAGGFVGSAVRSAAERGQAGASADSHPMRVPVPAPVIPGQ